MLPTVMFLPIVLSSHIFLDKGQSLVVSTIYTCVNFSVDIPLFIVRPRFRASNWGPQDIGNHRSSDFPRTFWREVACTYSIWGRTRTSLELNDVSSVLQSFNDFEMFGQWLWLLYGDGYGFNLSTVYSYGAFAVNKGLVYASTDYVNDPDDFLGTKLVLLSCIIGERRRRQGQEIHIVIEWTSFRIKQCKCCW